MKKFLKKLFLTAALVVTALLCLTCSASAAATSHSSHPLCASSCSCTSSSHSNLSWTAWDGTTQMYNGNYYLEEDIVLESTMILNYSYVSYLCLNGHSITCEDTVFDIYSYRSLLITDCKGTGKIETTNGDCTIGNNKNLSIWGGTIINSTDAYVSAINAYSGTSTTINGGRIEGVKGEGIYAYPGCKIQVNGGEVYGYHSAIDGHSDQKTFTGLVSISGGKLSVAPNMGSAVNFGSGDFTMTGGYVDGSVSAWAEPVTVKVSGGTITKSLDSTADNTYITGGTIGGLYMYGENVSVSAGTFSGSNQFYAKDTTISGGDFTNTDGYYDGVDIEEKTWISGGYFDNITVKNSLYLSGVPEIDTLTLYGPGKVYAQSPDSSGSFGGDTVKLVLESYYSDYEWKDGDIVIRNVKSDAVANKFVLAEESDYKSLVRSGDNLVLNILPNGTWGSNVTWYVDSDGTLYISGTGAIDYAHSGTEYPWYKYVNEIKRVVVEPGIVSIPQYAFEYLEKAETITLPETLLKLSLNAFNDCGSLNNIVLPSSLKWITGTSVAGHPQFIRCESLTDAYYLGTQEELYAATDGKQITSYSSNMTLHFLQLYEGTATCTEPGTLPYYRFDDTSVYDGYYDESKNLIQDLPDSPALGHRILALQETLVDPITINSESFELVNGVHYSVNKNYGTSSLLSITAVYDCTLTLDYGVSSFEDYDRLIIKHNNTQKDSISGNISAKTMTLNLSQGDTVTVSYTKDSSISIREDRGWVHLRYDKVTGMGYADAPAESGEAACTNGVVCRYCQTVVKEPLGHRIISQTQELVDPLTINNTSFSKSGNTYTSQNKTHSSSSLFMITAQYACTLKLNYGVSSEANYDKLIIRQNSTAKDTVSGSVSNKTMTLNLAQGDVVTVSYTKDYSASSGSDQGWVTLEYDKVTVTTEFDIPIDSVEAECGATVVCHYCQTVIFDGTQHKYESAVTAPTCTEQGFTTYTCECGDSYVSDYADALGHSYGAAVTAPTCTEQGFTDYTCECGDSYVADYVAALGHSYRSETTTQPTYAAEGVETFTCYVCLHSYTEAIEKLALAVPQNVKASSNNTAITLTWDAVDGARGYRIFRYSGGWKAVKTTTATSYTVQNLTAGTSYRFAVRAYTKNGSTVIWAPKYASIRTATAPVPPVTVKQTAGASTTVTVKWDACQNATGYRVYKYNSSTKKWETAVKATTKLTAKVTGLEANKKYYIAVKPYTKTDSGYVWGTSYTKLLVGTAPATPTIRLASTASGRATIAWSNVAGEKGYQVYYSTNASSGFTKISNYGTDVVKAYKTGLTSGKTYYFKVRSYRSYNGIYVYSPFSSVKSVTIK